MHTHNVCISCGLGICVTASVSIEKLSCSYLQMQKALLWDAKHTPPSPCCQGKFVCVVHDKQRDIIHVTWDHEKWPTVEDIQSCLYCIHILYIDHSYSEKTYAICRTVCSHLFIRMKNCIVHVRGYRARVRWANELHTRMKRYRSYSNIASREI